MECNTNKCKLVYSGKTSPNIKINLCLEATATQKLNNTTGKQIVLVDSTATASLKKRFWIFMYSSVKKLTYKISAAGKQTNQ